MREEEIDVSVAILKLDEAVKKLYAKRKYVLYKNRTYRDFIFLYLVCSDFSVTYTCNLLKFNFDCKIH